MQISYCSGFCDGVNATFYILNNTLISYIYADKYLNGFASNDTQLFWNHKQNQFLHVYTLYIEKKTVTQFPVEIIYSKY